LIVVGIFQNVNEAASGHQANIRQKHTAFGLIAKDLAEVKADLVVRNDNGDIYTVRYDGVNAMCNERIPTRLPYSPGTGNDGHQLKVYRQNRKLPPQRRK